MTDRPSRSSTLEESYFMKNKIDLFIEVNEDIQWFKK